MSGVTDGIETGAIVEGAVPVRVAVVGNSYAAYCQLPALRWAGEAEPVAIVGRDLDKARTTAARFQIPLATTSLDEALATRPDLVLVSTPVDLHAPMVEQILATTNAAILCEKPFTLEVDQARRLAALAKGRLCLVDHQLRWSAPRRRMKALVDGGAVGTPWVARTEMCFGSMERLTRKASWWDDVARGGGAMQAIASHLVDGLLWILGPVVDVQARLTTCVKERESDDGQRTPVTADDHCELWLTHASGARSTVLCTTVQVHGRRSLLEVIGSRGVVRLVDETDLGHGPNAGPFVKDPVRLASVEEVDACNDSAFARSEPLFLRDVVRAVAAGASSLPHAATFDDAVQVVQVLSAAQGR
jgi:predicted dehydrogenase